MKLMKMMRLSFAREELVIRTVMMEEHEEEDYGADKVDYEKKDNYAEDDEDFEEGADNESDETNKADEVEEDDDISV